MSLLEPRRWWLGISTVTSKNFDLRDPNLSIIRPTLRGQNLYLIRPMIGRQPKCPQFATFCQLLCYIIIPMIARHNLTIFRPSWLLKDLWHGAKISHPKIPRLSATICQLLEARFGAIICQLLDLQLGDNIWLSKDPPVRTRNLVFKTPTIGRNNLSIAFDHIVCT